MKKTKKMMLAVSVVSLMLGASTSLAAEKTKDEGWDVPNIALGNGLTEAEKKQTSDILLDDLSSVDVLKDIKSDPVNEFIVDGNDLVSYVTDVPEFTSDSKAYSSAFIARTKEGTGVNVDIMTPDKITARTEAMYRSAAITSGVYDAYIRIASVKVMDGSGALAGIYKIYDEVSPAENEEEQKVRDEQREVAQDQMQVVSEIDKENQDNENYSSENVLVMLADIQLELQKMSDTLSNMSEIQKQKEVEEVVNKQVKENGLEKALTPDMKEHIVDNMVAFSNTAAINDQEMGNQLSNLKEDIISNGKEFKDSILSVDVANKAKGFWQTIKDFFKSIFS